jgi:hypothetical protein
VYSFVIDSGALLHEEVQCVVPAPAEDVFEHVDHPERLSAHMARTSWRLGGSSMSIETDALGGRAVGSRIRLAGRMTGVMLDAECVVLRRDPPRFKAWETVGSPHLLVIGSYRMSVSIEPEGGVSNVTIDIDYALPPNRFWRPFGPTYARWCVRQMARDLVRQFASGRGAQ